MKFFENFVKQYSLSKTLRFELIPVIPILARIDVNAAKSADNNAKTNHILLPPLIPVVKSLHPHIKLIIYTTYEIIPDLTIFY